MVKLVFAFIATLFLTSACATGPCRYLKNEDQKKTGTPPPTGKPAAGSDGPKATPTPAPTPVPVVQVYKYDGSLQCGLEKGLSPEDMEKELQGIKVLARAKKPDGLMHIQVCGQPTGQINIYDIFETDLPRAVELGFKKWGAAK